VREWGHYWCGREKEGMEEDRRGRRQGMGGKGVCLTNVKLLPMRLLYNSMGGLSSRIAVLHRPNAVWGGEGVKIDIFSWPVHSVDPAIVMVHVVCLSVTHEYLRN